MPETISDIRVLRAIQQHGYINILPSRQCPARYEHLQQVGLITRDKHARNSRFWKLSSHAESMIAKNYDSASSEPSVV